LTLTNLLQARPLRVAVVGLGAGTVASYGMTGDYYCFYEINPDVIDIAQRHFTFLRDSPAEIHVEEGDARLSMERQAPRNYDVIALDAFSGDAIPTHLLTVEAMAVYMKHLNPNGVLAVHTSNRHLDLVPIVSLLAAHHDLNVVKVDADDGHGVADAASQWLLLTNNNGFLETPEVKAASAPVQPPDPEIRVWTDHYSNLFQILQ
ncbi:MAG: spermidine synthase, partial [Planctomycetota bacterium]